MKKFFLFVSLFAVIEISCAQKLEWAKSFNNGNCGELHMKVSDSGYVFIIADYFGPIDLDPDTGVFNITSPANPVYLCNTFIAKYDSLGRLLWVNTFSRSSSNQVFADDCALDKQGNIFIAGSFLGTVRFGTLFNSTQNSPSPGSLYIIKIDAAGNLGWIKTLYDAILNGITTDADGNCYATGAFYTTRDFDFGPGIDSLYPIYGTAFVLKLDPAGNHVWAKNFGTTGYGANAKRVAIDSNKDICVYGQIAGAGFIDFDPDTGTVYNLSHGFMSGNSSYISKLDSAGNLKWVKIFRGSVYGSSSVYQMAFNNLGDIYLTGAARSTDLDPDTTVYYIQGGGSQSQENYLCKLSIDGHFIWAKNMGQASGVNSSSFIALDNAGYVYYSDEDTLLHKMNTHGNTVWKKFMYNISNGPDFIGGSNIQIRGAGIYLCGIFKDTVDFDPGIGVHKLTPTTYVNNYQPNIYFLKWSECLVSNDITVTICQGSSYPFKGQLLTASGTYLDSLASPNGCDSIITLHLSVDSFAASSFNASICSGQSYFYNGQDLTQTGAYKDTLISSSGCDSIVTLVLTVDACTGISNSSFKSLITIYPNPATSQLNIYLGGLQAEQVSIYNVDGKLVSTSKQPKNNSIDISGLAAGVYIAEVKVRHAAQRVRWVKM